MAEWAVGLATGLAVTGGVLAVAGWFGILSFGLAEHPAQDRLNTLCTVGAIAFVVLAIVATAAILIAGGVGFWAWLIAGVTAIAGSAIAVLTVGRTMGRPAAR